MNIFILDKDLKLNAQYHCDKHISKMIVESAQILCTVKTTLDGTITPYKATHVNHPCTRWVMEKGVNWDYLVNLASSLNKEYCFRYNREIHKSHEVIKSLGKPNYKYQGKLSTFVFVDGGTIRGSIDSIINLYRARYIDKDREFKNPMKWKNRDRPKFMK